MPYFGQPAFQEEQSLSHRLKGLIPEKMYSRKPESCLLMSQKGALTDWHVNFTRTEVFY